MKTWPHTYGWLEHSVVPIQPAAVELLTALAGVLTRWGRWYLFGAQAVIAHGVPRLSADVDVTLEMSRICSFRSSPQRAADAEGESYGRMLNPSLRLRPRQARRYANAASTGVTAASSCSPVRMR
ncbi:MAG TPA: hypothetical protein VNA04_02405 [Thermoanaerobaculia bacterium]|nr:hypothetical protein [Thermoanaerobaculia bacterium]